MFEKFKHFVLSENLVSPESNTLLAVSGGVDSVVLCHLYAKAGFKYSIAHVNFKLRGADSDTDETFVRNIAERLGVRFITRAMHPSGEDGSTQMAARSLRYAWFSELIAEHGFSAVATAHHADDDAETILLNMVRGTGPDGLIGIRPKRGEVIRPLLFANKSEILEYARDEGLEWREDRSNASLDYSRNLLRHKVMPVLRQLNPSLNDTLQRNALRMSEHSLLLAEEVMRFHEREVSLEDDATIIKSRALSDCPHGTVILEKLLAPFGFTFLQCIQVMGLLPLRKRGKRVLSQSHELVIDDDTIIITQLGLPNYIETVIESIDGKCEVDGRSLTMEKLTAAHDVRCESSREACLDLAALKFPLLLRSWQSGDFFHPLGMRGRKKKLSDFLIDNKVPLSLKSRVMVLESDSQIAWVVGMRIDERFKVQEGTCDILRIRIL